MIYFVALTKALIMAALILGRVQGFQAPSVPGKASAAVVAARCAPLNGFMDGVQDFMKRFTMKATASHILIKGGAEAENKLEDLKAEIGDSPVAFAEAAAKYSECPSARSGGNLGEFGPGQMVKEFDKVVFNEPVGVVHGPVKTQFGYHLILVSERTE
jgi:peptidyl-prolyl cis-trans isomerase C